MYTLRIIKVRKIIPWKSNQGEFAKFPLSLSGKSKTNELIDSAVCQAHQPSSVRDFMVILRDRHGFFRHLSRISYPERKYQRWLFKTIPWEKIKVLKPTLRGRHIPVLQHNEVPPPGKTFPVSVKVLERCFGDATRRKITEAVLIDELSTNETMNGKAEWTYVKLNKLSTANW